MIPREQGFLLLSSHLGDPDRKCLTMAQLRTLSKRVAGLKSSDPQRHITADDLQVLGYTEEFAALIVELLSQQEQLQWYVNKGWRQDCFPITRASESYPHVLRVKLGLDAPGCMWAKGDVSLLKMPAIALVGSRELGKDNEEFAAQVGLRAAKQGYVLISGNARGADKAAQESCLGNGGKVISILPDELQSHPLRENVLYMSEDGFDMAFSTARALSRNRLIHTMAKAVFVAQCGDGKGGTWDGTVRNLARNWSPVFCFADGSEAAAELYRMGAELVQIQQLADLSSLI